MNFLLDTHTLIWYITDDKKLPNALGDLIENNEANCFISIVSLWGIGIKHSLNKITLKKELKEIFNTIDSSTIEILPIRPQHILKQSTLPFHHRDPFDRLLIAQAQIDNLTILTKDSTFSLYEVDINWN